jgi:FkbM family methyltransferase
MHYNGQLLLDKVLHEKYFLNKKNGTFIECGAFDGVIESNTLFFYENLDWRGYNIEPVPKIFEALKNNRKEDKNLNLALSNIDGISIFTQAIAADVPFYDGHFGNGSLQHTNDHLLELYNRRCKFEKYEVETITISTFYKKFKIDKQVDLFILDVEGHEAEVLSLLYEIDKNIAPNIIAVEYGHCGKENIFKHLFPLGYDLEYQDKINLVFKLTKND